MPASHGGFHDIRLPLPTQEPLRRHASGTPHRHAACDFPPSPDHGTVVDGALQELKSLMVSQHQEVERWIGDLKQEILAAARQLPQITAQESTLSRTSSQVPERAVSVSGLFVTPSNLGVSRDSVPRGLKCSTGGVSVSRTSSKAERLRASVNTIAATLQKNLHASNPGVMEPGKFGSVELIGAGRYASSGGNDSREVPESPTCTGRAPKRASSDPAAASRARVSRAAAGSNVSKTSSGVDSQQEPPPQSSDSMARMKSAFRNVTKRITGGDRSGTDSSPERREQTLGLPGTVPCNSARDQRRRPVNALGPQLSPTPSSSQMMIATPSRPKLKENMFQSCPAPNTPRDGVPEGSSMGVWVLSGMAKPDFMSGGSLQPSVLSEGSVTGDADQDVDVFPTVFGLHREMVEMVSHEYSRPRKNVLLEEPGLWLRDRSFVGLRSSRALTRARTVRSTKIRAEAGRGRRSTLFWICPLCSGFDHFSKPA